MSPVPENELVSEAEQQRVEVGLAHVATLAFVGGRTIPGFGFPVSLAGGTAIARATHRLGAGRGLAAGLAATIESIAILGPARLSGPGGQLATAPLIGSIERHGGGRLAEVVACTLIRALFNAASTALFILVIAGGLDAYAGTYDAIAGLIPFAPEGTGAALVATAAGLVTWAIGASCVQVYAFARASRRWDERGGIAAIDRPPEEAPGESRRAGEPEEVVPPVADLPAEHGRSRFDPRAVTIAALLAFALLLLSTAPALLAAVAAWLALAWALAPAERAVLKPGLLLAATVAVGAFVTNFVGGEGAGDGGEHAARAALLVLTATWMRGAAGADGFREVARRTLRRARRFPAAVELRTTLDALEGDRRLGEALRSLAARLRSADETLIELLDALIEWVAEEAERFRPAARPSAPALAYRPIDAAILIAAVLPALALAPG